MNPRNLIVGLSNMRYLVPTHQESEIHGRQEYLYDVFHIYFLPHETIDDFIHLIPVGCIGPDLLFIVGHYDEVLTYLSNNIDCITESDIIITTCFAERFIEFCNKKRIYVPIIEGSICPIRPGNLYGFEFDITDAELNLYNTYGSITERIKNGYRLLHL